MLFGSGSAPGLQTIKLKEKIMRVLVLLLFVSVCSVAAAEPAGDVTEDPAASDAPVKREPIGIGLNAKVGLLVPTNKLGPTVVVGVEVRERFPFLKRMLGLALEFNYFEPQLRGSGSDPAVGGDFSYSASARAYQLAVDALFFLPLNLPVDLYAGIGYSVFFYTTTERAFNAQTSEAQARHGLKARAGVQWPFWGPLYASFEVVYNYAAFDFLITGPVNAGAINLNVNFGFEL
jgi:hypothetical protein